MLRSGDTTAICRKNIIVLSSPVPKSEGPVAPWWGLGKVIETVATRRIGPAAFAADNAHRFYWLFRHARLTPCLLQGAVQKRRFPQPRFPHRR